MRGKTLHNLMAKKTRDMVEDFFESVDSEHRISNHQTTTYVDLFARKDSIVLAIEIETTVRHAVDNARKAAMVDVPLWVIVPTRRLKSDLNRKLGDPELRPGGKPIKILLLGELRQELANSLSWRINGRIKNKQTEKQRNTPSIGSETNHAN